MRCYYLSFSALVLFCSMITSCEVPVDIEEDAQIVVQSYFSNDQDLIVYVTESSRRGSNEIEKIVENASVALYTGDSLNFITTLQLCKKVDEPSFYTTIDFQPEINKQYKLNVDVPGFSPIHATNSIPDTVSHLIEIVDNSLTVLDDGGGMFTIDFDFDVTIEDPSGVKNYYHLLFFQELIQIEEGVDGGTARDTFMMDKNDLFIEPKTKTLNIKQIHDEPSFILSDEDFDGETVNIRFNGHYNYNQGVYSHGEFLIELRTVSKAYYDLMNSLTKEETIPGIGNGNNSYYTGNVTNAGGFFLGYSSIYKRLQF